MKKSFVFLFVLLSIFLFGCNRNKTISFDESDPLALAPDVSWAVVIDPYAAFRNDHNWTAEVVGHCRKSDIIMVKGKYVSPEGIWYSFESGWLPDSAISIYTNKLKAQKAASSLK